MKLTRLFALGLAIAAFLPIAASSLTTTAQAQNRPPDCAHGPDRWRVRGVASWDRLNMRSGPGSRRRIVGSIPPYGANIDCIGPCRGNWCRISWAGVRGWVNMRYLGE